MSPRDARTRPATGRLMAQYGERAPGSLPNCQYVAVAFVDLVTFTELGEMLPPDQPENLAGRLAELAEDIAVSPVRFVKTFGDAVMLVSTDTVLLIDALFELIGAAAAKGLPPLRAGVAAGLAVSSAADGFGSLVKAAIQVTHLALPATVLATDTARRSSSGADNLTWRPAGSHHLRGVPGQVELFGVCCAAQ
jgi:adenylate cyclase